MEIKRCSEVKDEVVYQIFEEGYSDYSISLKFTFEGFVFRFFEVEASRDLSFIMMDGERPVGFILGGIEVYDGIKTMRCGGYAVAPDMRSKGIGTALYEAHKALAIEQGCKRLFLEVLCDNVDALRLYERLGYRRVYLNKYMKLEHLEKLKRTSLEFGDYYVKEVSSDVALLCRQHIKDIHINWQGEMFTIQKFNDVNYYGLYAGHTLVGCLALRDIGYIGFLWIDDHLRHEDLAKKLLAYGVKKAEMTSVSVVTSSNMLFEGFLRKLGFEFVLDLHEMVQLL